MTWGLGFGSPWGGSPLVPTDQPLSEIGDDPITFDLTDEPDGPLPGAWEFYALTDDGAGTITGAAEADPPTYYRVSDGFGLWAYKRSPVVGAPFFEQGVAASPSAVLEGRNSRVSALFRSPLDVLDPTQDQFVFEVVVGVRLEDAGTTFVGGRVRAEWDSGSGWTTRFAFDAVQAAGGPLTTLAAGTPPDIPDLLDLWRNSAQHEVEVEIRGSDMTVMFDGTVLVGVTVPADGPAKPLLMARIYNRSSTLITAEPAIIGLQLQSLRDLDRLGPAPQIGGDQLYDTPTLPVMRIPSATLLDAALWKRIGGRMFEAKVDHVVDVAGSAATWKAGDMIRATERVHGQLLVPFVFALAAMRGRDE